MPLSVYPSSATSRLPTLKLVVDREPLLLDLSRGARIQFCPITVAAIFLSRIAAADVLSAGGDDALVIAEFEAKRPVIPIEGGHPVDGGNGVRCRQSERGKVVPFCSSSRGGPMPAERLPMRKVREVLRQRYVCGASERVIAQSLGIGRTASESTSGARL
jgi:hypothetical protein